MNTPEDAACKRYEIRIQGKLDDKWLVWFSNLLVASRQITGPQPVTLLVCEIADQAQLRGILNKLWDLNLTLIGVKRLDDPAADANTPGSQMPEN